MNTITTSETFHVVNVRGVAVSTFDNAVSARLFAKAECSRRGPLTVVHITTSITRRKVGRTHVAVEPAADQGAA